MGELKMIMSPTLNAVNVVSERFKFFNNLDCFAQRSNSCNCTGWY